MYEDLAWKNFLKTGSVESFLEYKKISEMKNSINDDINICEDEEENVDYKGRNNFE